MSSDQKGQEQAGDLENPLARLDALSHSVESLWDEVNELREQREMFETTIDQLESDLERLDSRTNLLELVEHADEMSSKQRSIALIQHLKRAAERKRERGRPAKAAVDRDGAEQALQYPDVDRTTIYTDMQRAERLVDNTSLLEYETGDRGARLKLSLEEGSLPSDVLGEGLNGGN